MAFSVMIETPPSPVNESIVLIQYAKYPFPVSNNRLHCGLLFQISPEIAHNNILQIIATQPTAYFTARKQNYQALFVELSASSYVIAGAVFMSIIKICTDNSSIAILNGIAYTLELFFTAAFLLLHFSQRRFITIRIIFPVLYSLS